MPATKVLVVEDHPLVLLVAVAALRSAGLTVVPAESADEAAAVLRVAADEINAVFSDIETPGQLNGLDLARTIKENWPALPVVLTSGRIKPSSEDLPQDVRFIPKPYDLDSVCAVVAALVSDQDPPSENNIPAILAKSDI